MLRSAFRKEILELTRDGRFRALVTICALLVLSSMLLGYREYAALSAESHGGAARSRSQWTEQGEKNPHVAAHFGVHVFREPGLLAMFDRGLLSFSGASVFLEAHKQNLPVHAGAQDGTLARRLGEWLPANVVQIIAPLLIILLMFGSVAQERERGSWLLLRSMAGSLRAATWSKLLAGGLALGAALAPAGLVGFAVTAVRGPLSADLLLRVTGLTLAYGLYLGCFLLLSVTISLRAKTSRGALVALLALWVAWVIVAPRAVTNAAGDAHPQPRWAEVEHQLSEEQGLTADSTAPYERRIDTLRRETLARYGVQDLAQLPVNFGGTTLLAGENWGNAAFDRRFGELYRIYRAQEALIRTAGWFTPILSLRAISMSLSSTGLDDEIAFRRAAETYRRELVYRMNKAVQDHTEEHFTADADLWRSVPPFQHIPRDARAALRRHATDFAVLAAWLAMALLGLLWTLRRAERETVR